INERFQKAQISVTGNEVAVAKTPGLLWLNVPEQYKHNLPRYLRVIRLIPLRENLPITVAKGQAAPLPNTGPSTSYRQQLAGDLLDPARTVSAALRLEALGTESIPALKEGLKSDHTLVRFCAAEGLAYLGSHWAADELARLVETQPILRAFSLTALASLNE